MTRCFEGKSEHCNSRETGVGRRAGGPGEVSGRVDRYVGGCRPDYFSVAVTVGVSVHACLRSPGTDTRVNIQVPNRQVPTPVLFSVSSKLL